MVPLPVLGADVGHDVLVEELEDERDAVGEHQVLRDDLKLLGGMGGAERSGGAILSLRDLLDEIKDVPDRDVS